MATKKSTAMNLRDVAVIYNSGNYHGYAPTVACKKAGDVAYDTCGVGRLWQWTGQRWAPLLWMSGARFILGEGNSVQEKINSPGSMIPEYIKLYPGDAPEVPADLRWKDTDLCINHNMGILPAQISCTYLDPLSQVWVTVEPEDGSCLTSIDGSWTVWRNFFCVTGTGKTVITLTELINECDEGGGPIPDPSSSSSDSSASSESSSSSAEPSSSSSASSDSSSSSSSSSSGSVVPTSLDDIQQGTYNKYLSAEELAFLQSLIPAVYVNEENAVVFRTAPKVLGPDGQEQDLSINEDAITFRNPEGYESTDPIKATVGGLESGMVVDGMKIIPLMQKMLFPYDKPEIRSFSIQDSQLECGESTETTETFQFQVTNTDQVVADTTKLTAEGGTVLRSGFDVSAGSLTVSNMTPYQKTEPGSLSFQLSFTDTEGNQTAAATAFQWSYAGFFHTDQNVGDQPDPADIEDGTYQNADGSIFDGSYIRTNAADTKVLNLSEGTLVKLPIPEHAKRVYIAVPNTLTVSSIKSEATQYNYLTAFIQAELSVPIAGNTKTVPYRVYLYQALASLSADTFLVQL